MICKICDNSFSRVKSNLKQRGRGKYCSKKCRHIAHSLYISGKNHPFFGKKHRESSKRLMSLNHADYSLNKHSNWRDGKSFEEYGVEFNNNLKEQVRFRDKYKCKLCDCPQIENGRQLDVHHIDYDKKNNKLQNLIALCWRCHIKTNFNRKYWTKFFKEKINALYQSV